MVKKWNENALPGFGDVHKIGLYEEWWNKERGLVNREETKRDKRGCPGIGRGERGEREREGERTINACVELFGELYAIVQC